MSVTRAPSLGCLRTLRTLAISSTHSACPFAARHRHASTNTSPQPPKANGKPAAPPVDYQSPATRRKNADREPQLLTRPLGLSRAPQWGDNTGADQRTLRQRRDDFVNYDKHLERRARMTSQISRSYFRDFNDMKYSKGKTFIAPDRIFKAEHAQYFPNLRGRTLNGKEGDTTDVLKGRVSVVSVFSSGWAENQIRTWCSREENPDLHALLEDHKGLHKSEAAQAVSINHELNVLKYWIIRLFSYRLRASRSKELWGKYFVVHKGFADHLRESLAVVNQRVGYVYVLDPQCKIRWAGSAVADEREKASMVASVKRLLVEAKAIKSTEAAQVVKPGQGTPALPQNANAEAKLGQVSAQVVIQT